MNKTLVKCALVGGIIVFVWMMLSWMVFPWHMSTLNRFSNEHRVAQVIRENAPVSGMYLLPNMFQDSGMDEDRMSEGKDLMRSGPVMFASIRLYGMDGRSSMPFIIALLIQIVGAYMITWLLMHTKGMNFKKQVTFVTIAGLTVGVLGLLPAWNWWGFPAAYVFICMIDLVIGWCLAGMAIAKLSKH